MTYIKMAWEMMQGGVPVLEALKVSWAFAQLDYLDGFDIEADEE
jgi:hypothetical protein